MSGRAKNWVFTLNNPTNENTPSRLPDGAEFIYFGREVAPTTGTPHLQGFICMVERRRLQQMTGILPGAHLAVMLGTIAQNVEYCSKCGVITQYGTQPQGRGKRTDLQRAVETLQETKSLADVATAHPEVFVKYHKGLAALSSVLEEPEQRDIDVLCFIGPTASGKTRWAYDHFAATDIYKLNTNTNNTLWFDGYYGQSVLLIDDFTGWIRFRELLTILDRYPYRCQVKGSSVWAKWTTVIITSEFSPAQWYKREDGNIDQLIRRIRRVYTFPDDMP